MRMPCSSSAGQQLVLQARAPGAPCGSATMPRIASSVSRGVRPSCSGVSMPASTWSCRPATRTMKNSSRLLAAIARNFSRSSSGTSGVLGELEHALVELQPRQLAVEVQLGVLEVELGGDRRRLFDVLLTGRSDRYRPRARAGRPRANRRGRSAAAARARCAAASSTVSPAGISSTRSRSIENRCATASRRLAREHAHRALQRLGVEHGADQPPQRRRAAADRHGGVDRRQREPLEDAVGVLAHRVQLGRRRRVRAAVAVGRAAPSRRGRTPTTSRPRRSVPIASSVEPPPTSTTPTLPVERLAERARGAEERQPRLLRRRRAPRPRRRRRSRIAAVNSSGVGGAADRRGRHHAHAPRSRAARPAPAARPPPRRPRRSSRAGSRRP